MEQTEHNSNRSQQTGSIRRQPTDTTSDSNKF
jgi:hypothetical protein